MGVEEREGRVTAEEDGGAHDEVVAGRPGQHDEQESGRGDRRPRDRRPEPVGEHPDDERYGEERQRDAAHQRGASENEAEEEPARRRHGGHRIVPAHEEVESGGEQAAERHLAHGDGRAEDVAGEDGQDGCGGEPDRRGEQTRRDRVDEEAGERTEERVHRPRRGEAVPEEPVRGAEDGRIAGREERGRLPEVPDVALAVRQMAGEEVVDAHVEEERGSHVGPEREGASQPDRERQHEDRRERQTAATPVPSFEEPRLLR